MGFSLCWAAVRGKKRALVLAELFLHATGDREDLPESPLVGAELPGGWYLVLSNRDSRFARPSTLELLSSRCEVVACQVDESSSSSEASGWSDGTQLWSIVHLFEKTIWHVETRGEPPEPFVAIRDRLRVEQQAAGGNDADVDFLFDVPVELAQALTGFRHDLDLDGVDFETLDS
jgi:hypothetical protein